MSGAPLKCLGRRLCAPSMAKSPGCLRPNHLQVKFVGFELLARRLADDLDLRQEIVSFCVVEAAGMIESHSETKLMTAGAAIQCPKSHLLLPSPTYC